MYIERDAIADDRERSEVGENKPYILTGPISSCAT